MRQLIDGDCPIDHYQWAMQAGVTVASSGGWTRIYHPGQVAVGRCDPHGLFIRRWLPELAGLTNDQLGAPPQMAAYPKPILDYESARRRRLELLQRQRLQIVDVRQAMARPPRDASGAALALFPAALDLDTLEPRQWNALLSWFRPGRSSDTGPAAASQRRNKGQKQREAPGQLSLDLFPV
jgi:deoxyribodipyrimidine photo-lyase